MDLPRFTELLFAPESKALHLSGETLEIDTKTPFFASLHVTLLTSPGIQQSERQNDTAPDICGLLPAALAAKTTVAPVTHPPRCLKNGSSTARRCARLAGMTGPQRLGKANKEKKRSGPQVDV